MPNGVIFFIGLFVVTVILCIIGLMARFRHSRGLQDATDFMLWTNGTYAILSRMNNWPVYRFGWYKPNHLFKKTCKNNLKTSWGIETVDELNGTIQRLTSGMHNSHLLEIAKSNEFDIISRDEFNKRMEELDSKDSKDSKKAKKAIMEYTNVFDAYQKFGQNAILGWDLSRAVSLCSMGYAAGLLTYNDGLSKAVQINKHIQITFDSWDNFYESYMDGYVFWSKDDVSSKYSEYKDRLKILQDLKNEPKSFYHVDWNFNLDKR